MRSISHVGASEALEVFFEVEKTIAWCIVQLSAAIVDELELEECQR